MPAKHEVDGVRSLEESGQRLSHVRRPPVRCTRKGAQSSRHGRFPVFLIPSIDGISRQTVMSKRRPPTAPPSVPRRRARRTHGPAPFPTLEPFARRLESLRLERALTQRALAARARISTNHYQDIAHAEANPTVIVLLRLASALGVSLDDLFELPPPDDDRRSVLTDDLRELVTASRQLSDVVKRLAKSDRSLAPRSVKGPQHA